MKVKEGTSSSSYASRIRFGISLVIVLMVISSPTVMLVNPALIAASISKEGSGSNIDAAPSTISQGGDFTSQAALTIPRTFQSTDIVNSKGIYEVSFITSTTGAIDKIEIAFPAGTNIGQASVIERVGIGGGVLTKVGTTLTYDLTTPVSVPAGTFIRLEISAIKNPTTPSTSLTATITSKDSGGAIIDGPTATNAYEIRGLSQRIVNGGQSAAVAPGETVEAPGAICEVNEVVVGGGYGVFEGNAESFMVPINEQAADNGWFVKMNNRSPPGGESFTFAAQAVCLQL